MFHSLEDSIRDSSGAPHGARNVFKHIAIFLISIMLFGGLYLGILLLS